MSEVRSGSFVLFNGYRSTVFAFSFIMLLGIIDMLFLHFNMEFDISNPSSHLRDHSIFIQTHKTTFQPLKQRNIQSCRIRPPHIEDLRKQRIRPLILYYSYFWYNQWGTLKDVYMKRFDANGQHHVDEPSCYSCESTTDSRRFAEADIVVFHLPNVGANIPKKYCGQFYAVISLEAPPYYDDFKRPQSLTRSKNLKILKQFDISSTYRLDSDIPLPHFTFWYEEHFKEALMKPIKVPLSQRDFEYPVAWIASKCKTNNNRIAYVRELMKYIGVKSYGKCLNNADIPKGPSYDAEAMRALSYHKFYLSFENSNCDYYITEKLTRTLELGVIPVIFGAPQASTYLPNHNSGIVLNASITPKELAQILHRINQNHTLFESYLAYKSDPEKISAEFKQRWFKKHRHRACKLCDIAKRMRENSTLVAQSLKGMDLDLSCQTLNGSWWNTKSNT